MEQCYKGLCGATITATYYGDYQTFECSCGHSMQCDSGSGYPLDLCDRCRLADIDNKSGGECYGRYC